MKGFALGLALKQGRKASRKSPQCSMVVSSPSGSSTCAGAYNIRDIDTRGLLSTQEETVDRFYLLALYSHEKCRTSVWMMRKNWNGTRIWG